MPSLRSGRVAVQQEWNGAVISIRAARDWTLLIFVIWLTIWVTMPTQLVLATLRGLSRPGSSESFGILWSIGWVLATCFVASRILWALGGVEELRLTAAELELEKSLFGISLRRRKVPTNEVHNLRFVPSFLSGRNRVPSRIAFEDARGTVKFASGVEDSEAFAVIEAMLAVYPFPKQERAVAYIAEERTPWRR